ncbi:MAG: hypothetical protein ALECFALPRED_005048 [Alectoria fallacina]|uniref:Uncharacterized protein n=1 Tax=Alectoria fallacina TaxID=1903189 RepID=A0A8H3FX36_9LECA|nr:MAG: hypothetical protein ALECFALPRED_005048 [Alectoria fallacina]
MAFPSKRDIKGRVTNGENVVSFPKGFIWPSKVTFLEIYQSAIDAASFSGSLCEIRGPLRFVYSFRAGALVGDQRWESCQIVRIFDVHTGKILSHLELAGLPDTERAGIGDFDKINYNNGKAFIGSLCTFEVL